MIRTFAGAVAAVFILGASSLPSAAAISEGRSVRICSDQAPVCAFMQDGTTTPMSECRAKSAGAIRIVPGECDDAD